MVAKPELQPFLPARGQHADLKSKPAKRPNPMLDKGGIGTRSTNTTFAPASKARPKKAGSLGKLNDATNLATIPPIGSIHLADLTH